MSTSTPSSKALLSRLLGTYVRHHGKHVTLAIICMVIAAIMTSANAWLMQPVLDDIFLKQDRQMLAILPFVVFAIALVNGLAVYGQTMFIRHIGVRIIADMQMDLFAHLMRADLKTFYDQSAGRLISRFTNDIQMMRAAVSNVLTGLAKELLTMIGLVGVMIYQSWELSLIAFILFPVAVWPVIRLGRRMRKLSGQTQSQLGQFAGQLDDIFSGARMVKAYGQEQYEISRARASIEELFRLYFKSARVQAAAAPMMEMLAGLAIAGVIWYGGAQVLAGHTTPGAFFSFIAAMIMAYKPIKTLTTLNNNLQEGLASAQRFFAVLDTEPLVKDLPGAVPLVARQGSIRFDHVRFLYTPDGGGVENITLEIPSGSTAALVGPSGSGKTTILNLLLRFYDPDAGAILIDNQPIREVTLASLRSQIALVSQDTVLFDDTIRANIAYGRMGATAQEIEAVAHAAAADEFIKSLPQGYDTVIGPHGVRLSGGQRQRLAIARAMLKNAPILVLDEATSSLDALSERSVQQALSSLMKGRTTLIVAHRLSTVLHADRIYVLSGGHIVEHGTHEELLARGGAYHQLYAPQQDGAAATG